MAAGTDREPLIDLSSRRPEPTVSVVIPAKNEALNLPQVLTRIPVGVDEVILVDGDSVDDTVAVARALLPGNRCHRPDPEGKRECACLRIRRRHQ